MIDVTCAIIRNEENDILVVQRGPGTDHPYKWEFPGGKTNEGESHEDCIIREIDEELSMEIVIRGSMASVDYDYGIKKIRLIPFICDTLDELPVLNEHIDFRWVTPGKLTSVDLAEADQIVASNYLSTSVSKDENYHQAIAAEDDEKTDNELKDLIQRMMSMKEADWMALSAIENPAIFRKLISFSYSDDRKLAFRASWTLTKVCDKNPSIIFPYLDQIADALGKSDNESVERSFLRILSLTELERLDQTRHGRMADHCFSLLNSPVTAIAIKAYSMEILWKLTTIYPELANELAASISGMMDEGSGGLKARGRMILKRISADPGDR
ncbi:MAG: (deoxy)nucleoside triphosphate pyrophosphohydrolase [Bacteroidales bacterium]